MERATFLDAFPLWTLFPITLVIGLMAVEIGSRVARRRGQRAQDKTEAPPAPILAGTLGLLAFLLAFTFGMAASRFEERKQNVLAESNAINTSYLRAAMLPQPMSTNSRNMLREYVDLRLAGVQPGQYAQAVAKSEELQQRLWAEAVAAGQKEKSPMTSIFMQSLNDVIGLHQKRIMAAVYNRVPAAIWIGLYVLLFLAMAVVGYYDGMSGTRHSLAVFAMVLAFSAVLALIADLDRPGQGLLEVNQKSMLDLRKSMSASLGLER